MRKKRKEREKKKVKKEFKEKKEGNNIFHHRPNKSTEVVTIPAKTPPRISFKRFSRHQWIR
jgi:hypothetical protein